MQSSLFFALSVQSDNSRNNGNDADGLAQNAADGEIEDVVDQPQGRAAEAELAYRSRVLGAEADGREGHCHGGQDLQEQIGNRDSFFKDGKGQYVRACVDGDEESQPGRMVGVHLFRIGKEQGTQNGNGVQQASHDSPKHSKVDHKKEGSEELDHDQVFLGFGLVGKTVHSQSRKADDLGDDFKRFHFLHLKHKYESL